MKVIMSDDDAPDSVDTEDTEEEIYCARSRKSLRRQSSNINLNSNQNLDQNNSIRRSNRNKSLTYDNLNCSWIFGTQTLKGYPMYKQNDSSSDKEMVDDPPPRVRRRPLRSRENDSSSQSPIKHSRSKNIHGSSRELRDRPRRLRDRIVYRGRELRSRRPDRNRVLHERQERDHESSERSVREMRRNKSRFRERPERELRDKSREMESRTSKERQDEDSKDDQNDIKDKADTKTTNDEKELRSKQSDIPSRLRVRPTTRLSNSHTSKDETKEKKDNGEEEEEEDEEEEDDENSQESEKGENNEHSENEENEGYQDMYSRVKRTRRVSQRQLQKRQMREESDMSESSDEPGPKKYSLRQKKPTVDRFQINVEPVRRSIRAFRSVVTNYSMSRSRKHRSKSSSSSDSSDSEAQCYDKKKSKKSRQNAIPQGGPSDKKADISPITVDTNITFNDVGGLESHIHCLKEMVVFPMMYPDVFDRFHVVPPKGVLFHGPPGTGKTLIARALANECSQGSRKVSFFMRKGADCLTKWVGESERQLRLLFEQAQQMKPSIIFFDEIDGLAPVRSTKQDQIHASIVSTLLALMDGLTDRGEVIVIGATNRIDAIDPALRRPGRFDRELFFPLPAMKERLEILKIHVKKWAHPPNDELLEILADKATGYCGSDLKALCTEAVIQGLKRTYPQIYLTNKRLLLNPDRVEVKKTDFTRASSLLVPASHRVAPCVGKKLAPFIEPLLNSSLQEIICMTKKIFPQGTSALLAKLKVTKGIHRPRLLISGGNVARNQGPHLAKAIIFNMEHLPVHVLNVSTLFAESARSPEETCVQVFNEASRNIPSIIYIDSIDQWWPLVPETVKAVILCRISSLDPSTPILILATCEDTYNELPDQLKNLFSTIREEVYTIAGTTEEQRSDFFKPIFTVQSLRPPLSRKKNVKVLEKLPLAPDPLPKKLTTEEKKVLYEKQEISLRELRIFLREICAKLARNRQFFMFTKPVDTEEVPDYNEIIQHPMDLETMMTKIDRHCYLCARDFLNDIDLICQNALEYNPDRDPADKLIRHRACSLRDNAYALIKAELDSDFEDKCREISKNRKFQDGSDKKKDSKDSACAEEKGEKRDSVSGGIVFNGKKIPSSRKRRLNAWARGYVKKVHKKKKISFEDSTNDGSKPTVTSENEQGIDLEKFQDFESEAHGVLNGRMPVDDNTDSQNESHDEDTKDGFTNNSENPAEKRSPDKKNNSHEMDTTETIPEHEAKPHDNSGSLASSRRESLIDDLTLALDSDSSQENEVEDSDKVLIDKNELNQAFLHTVEATKKFSIELLCDVFVQLSRRVGQYSHTFNRKSLPKDLLEDVKRFKM